MKHKRLKYLFVSSVLFVLAHNGHAQTDAQLSEFISAQATFENSLAGDASQTDAAIEQFQALSKRAPSQPLFLAYLGSAYALRARDAWMPWTQISNVEEGMEKLDKALSMLSPEHDVQTFRGSIVSTELRLVAISTFLQVPDFFNRFQPAKDLLAETLKSPVYEVSAPLVKGRIQIWAAEIAKRDHRSTAQRQHLEQAITILKTGQFAEIARQKLAELAE